MPVLLNEYKKIQFMVDSLVLPFIKNQHPKWRELILAYLEFLDENALNKSMNITDNVGVDSMYSELLGDFLDLYFKDVIDINKFGLNDENKRLFISLSKLIGNLKSTKTSFGFFFNSFSDFSIPSDSGDINVTDLSIELKEMPNWWLENNDPTRPFTYIFKIDTPELANLKELIKQVHPAGWVQLFLFEVSFDDESGKGEYMDGYDCFELDIIYGAYYTGKFNYDGMMTAKGIPEPMYYDGGYTFSDDLNCAPTPRFFGSSPEPTFDLISEIGFLKDFSSSPSIGFDLTSDLEPMALFRLSGVPEETSDDAFYMDSASYYNIIGPDLRVGITSSGMIAVIIFPNFAWPEDYIVTNAELEWYCNGVGPNPDRLVVWSMYGGAYDDAVMPTDFLGFYQLARTSNFSLYQGLTETKTVGNVYQITGFEDPINEIISRDGWVQGNNLMLIINYGPGCNGDAWWNMGSYDGWVNAGSGDDKPRPKITLEGIPAEEEGSCWLEKTDDTVWTDLQGTWNGSEWTHANQIILDPPIGDWEDGFQPTRMKIYRDVLASTRVQLTDGIFNIVNKDIEVGPEGFEFDCGWMVADNIQRLLIQDLDSLGVINITKIEFFTCTTEITVSSLPDGYIRNSGTDFETVRDATFGDQMADDNYRHLVCCYDTGSTIYIYRQYFFFDLHDISITDVLSAKIDITRYSLAGSSERRYVMRQVNATAPLGLSDYSDFTGPLFSDPVTTDNVQRFEFNDAGKAFLLANVGNVVCIGLQEYDHDYLNVAPDVGVNSQNNYFSEESNVDKTPKLTIFGPAPPPEEHILMVYSDDGDGNINGADADWATARSVADEAFQQGNSEIGPGVNNFGGPYYVVGRSFYEFDLSFFNGVNREITDIALDLVGYTYIESSFQLYSTTWTGETALGDFNNFGSTIFFDAPKTLELWDGGYPKRNVLSLNEAGLEYIATKYSGKAAFCLREFDHDVSDSAPDENGYRNGMYFSEIGYQEHQTNPRLILTYNKRPLWVEHFGPTAFSITNGATWDGSKYISVGGSVELTPVGTWFVDERPIKVRITFRDHVGLAWIEMKNTDGILELFDNRNEIDSEQEIYINNYGNFDLDSFYIFIDTGAFITNIEFLYP